MVFLVFTLSFSSAVHAGWLDDIGNFFGGLWDMISGSSLTIINEPKTIIAHANKVKYTSGYIFDISVSHNCQRWGGMGDSWYSGVVLYDIPKDLVLDDSKIYLKKTITSSPWGDAGKTITHIPDYGCRISKDNDYSPDVPIKWCGFYTPGYPQDSWSDQQGCNYLYHIEFKQPCTPNWVCGGWSGCTNKKQTRACNDGCGNTRTEEKECGLVVCGDGICSGGENEYNCPQDCKFIGQCADLERMCGGPCPPCPEKPWYQFILDFIKRLNEIFK